MQKLSFIRLLLSTLTLIFSSNYALAIEQTSETKATPLNIPFSLQAITVDGLLNDPIWSDALEISLDIVNDPWNNLASPVKTEAKIIEDGQFLYISFLASDPNPEKIQAYLGDRDSRWADDLIGIKLDPYNNRRLNYEFLVNPHGVQHDSIYNEMTGGFNNLWDGIWYAAGKITEQGYQVEMAIPYTLLNFEDSDDIKTWAIELVRFYPRETYLEISHVNIDRNNPCWLCQYPEAKGFKQAKAGHKLQITPVAVATSHNNRDLTLAQPEWQQDDQLDIGVDIRWGITPNTSLSLTVNPDFSSIETDDGQLNVNETFSLYYQEKRAFFLDNSDYFTTNYNLVYTRNIVSPDYGVKLTSSQKKHSYGLFITHDQNTHFINPGNLSSSTTTLAQESHSGALRYRYDYSDSLSVGTISTLRSADNYHNYVFGIDGKYRFDDSNTLYVQTLHADSAYPELTQQTDSSDKLTDQAYKIELTHNSEYWQLYAGHKNIGKAFRADLGFMPRVDLERDYLQATRLFYGETTDFWHRYSLSGRLIIRRNQNNELMDRTVSTNINLEGPLQSYMQIKYINSSKVGVRQDNTNNHITNNADMFEVNQWQLSANFYPLKQLYSAINITLGDEIDYDNNRLGKVKAIHNHTTWNINTRLELDLEQHYRQLNVGNNTVFTAYLTDVRLAYQFNLQSYIKLNLLYNYVDYPENNTVEKSLSTQLIYGYKINPQTVFYLGYSDNHYQDMYSERLRQEQKTFFSKISYAWMP